MHLSAAFLAHFGIMFSLLVKCHLSDVFPGLDAAFSHDLEQQQGSSHAGNKSKYPMGFERMGSSGLASR
jgi:hypothetical protein